VNLVHQKKELQSLLNERRKQSESIGLVPTMGALHEGHLSLIHTAIAQCDQVVISIFVNPTQFDNDADLQKYPRTLEDDIKLLENKFDNLIIFAPENHEIYGDQAKSAHFEFGKIANKMEGASRAGHFDGVGTILEILFKTVAPDKAYFGEKDYQQLLIVKKLVEILNLPIDIVGCPISRQENGLARSSRNTRLTPGQQEKASFIFKCLIKAREKFDSLPPVSLIEEIKQDFENNPDFKLDYFEIVNQENLEPISNIVNGQKYRAFVAAEIGGVRLIDNMALN